MKKLYTEIIDIGNEATLKLHEYVKLNYKSALVVCDTNTVKYAEKMFPQFKNIVFPADIHATDVLAGEILPKAEDIDVLIACGSGTIHDLTRYAAHKMNKPFISYPTAASVDGFVSNVAAMTIKGQKITYPSTAPKALFADPSVFNTAPHRLTVSGVGDIIGKYVSLFEWKIGNVITGESLDDEIIKLETDAIADMLRLEPDDEKYSEAVMKGLVLSGMAIQMFGNSRPASGAEHHLSHLWEMNCINSQTDALHGEKVGVATLIIIDKYKSLTDIVYVPKSFDKSYLFPIFGKLTDGIISENTPCSLINVNSERIEKCKPQIFNLIDELPSSKFVYDYFKKIGALTSLFEIDLPDTSEFINETLKYAHYVRNRLTLLKII